MGAVESDDENLPRLYFGTSEGIPAGATMVFPESLNSLTITSYAEGSKGIDYCELDVEYDSEDGYTITLDGADKAEGTGKTFEEALIALAQFYENEAAMLRRMAESKEESGVPDES